MRVVLSCPHNWKEGQVLHWGPVVLPCCANIKNTQLPIDKLSPSGVQQSRGGRAGPLPIPRLLAPGDGSTAGPANTFPRLI